MFRDRQALRVLLLALVVTVTTSLPRGGEARETFQRREGGEVGETFQRREGGEGGESGVPCCTPPQWTAVLSYTAGSVNHSDHQWSQGTVTYHYDSVNQREAYSGAIKDGSPLYQRIIWDFKKQFAAFIFNDQMCSMYHLEGDFKPVCTPDNVNVTFGLWAIAGAFDSGFAENTMYYEREGLTGHLVVTSGDVECAFVESSEFTYGTPHVSSVRTVQYFNQTLTVNPDVFTLPKQCKSVAPGGADASHVMEELKRMTGFSAALVG